MGQVGSVVLLVFSLFYGPIATVRILGGLERSMVRLGAAVRAEYRHRLCGALSAASQNLRDAGRYWDLARPQSADFGPGPGIGAEELAGQLAAELEAHYADYGPPLVQPGALCPLEASLPIAAALHWERNRQRPAPWPNWTVRFISADGAY